MGNELNPNAYLRQHRFSKTERFVVHPANTTHILIAEMSNGQVYVCVERVQNAVWNIDRKAQQQAFQNRYAAEAFAAALHRAETRAQKEQLNGTPP